MAQYPRLVSSSPWAFNRWASALLMRKRVSLDLRPHPRTRVRNCPICLAAAKPTSSGVTLRVTRARTSRRDRLCSRCRAWVSFVGGGGKRLRVQLFFQRFVEGFLILFDRQYVIASPLKDDLLCGHILRVQGIHHHQLALQVLAIQEGLGRRDLIALVGHGDRPQPAPALHPEAADQLDAASLTQGLAIDGDDPIGERTQLGLLPVQEDPLQPFLIDGLEHAEKGRLFGTTEAQGLAIPAKPKSVQLSLGKAPRKGRQIALAAHDASEGGQ